MRVKVRTLRKAGQLILPSPELPVTPRFAGVLSIDEKRDLVSGRTMARAKLTGITTGPETDLLPELMDVRLIWAKDQKLRMAGFERIGNAEYSQTWSIEVVLC
ncbi:MAG: hypothetical protein JWR21_2382 [Herminiimonas sp.]|nr:hypothetical protein [Herminiimonas sp.]